MATDEGFPVVQRSVRDSGYIPPFIRVDPANFTDVPGDLANSTEVFNCLKLPWRRYGMYGLGLPYNFLDAALYSLSLLFPNASLNFQSHCLGSATGLATDLRRAQATTHRKYVHQVKSVVIFGHVTNDVILKVGIACRDSSVMLP